MGKEAHAVQTLETSFVLRAMSLAFFTLATDSNAQEILRPYAPPLLHTFLEQRKCLPGKRDGGPVEWSFLCGLASQSVQQSLNRKINLDGLCLRLLYGNLCEQE